MTHSRHSAESNAATTQDFTRGWRVPPIRSQSLGEHRVAMASTTTPRRSEAGLSLRATVTQGGQRADRTESPVAPPISWPAIAVVGGLVTAMASWILTAGIVVVGWLVADPGTLAQVPRRGHPAVAARQRRQCVPRGHRRHRGAVGGDRAHRLHAVPLRRCGGPPGAGRPDRRAGRDHRGAGGDLPGAGGGGRGLARRTLARPGALGGGHRRARRRSGVGQQPRARRVADRRLAGLGPRLCRVPSSPPSWCCSSPALPCWRQA